MDVLWQWRTCKDCEGLWKGLTTDEVFFSGCGAAEGSGMKNTES